MSLLTIVQRFCKRTGIASPNTVYGSTNEQIVQIMGLLEEEGAELSGRGAWQQLVQEATHTTLAAENQGAIETIASGNFRYIVNKTAWDRSANLPLMVIDGPQWQAIKGFSSTGPQYSIRIRGGNLLANPAPAAGSTWAFEYISWNWILDNDGSTRKQYFTEDTDTVLLPEPIVMMGLRWRWKKEKGFDYQEDFISYESMVKDALSRDGIKKSLNMGDSHYEPRPGYTVNQGNWPL